MVLEAISSGVSASPFDISYQNNPNIIYEVYQFNCDQNQMDSSISQCMNRLETAYGFLEYIFLIYRYINEWLGRNIQSQNNWCQQGTICSGLVRQFIEGSGYPLFQGFGRDNVTPQDVYNTVKANPKLFQLIKSKN